MTGIALVCANDKQGLYELIAKATSLNLTPVAFALSEGAASDLIAHGASKVIVVEGAHLADHQPGPIAEALAAAQKDCGAQYVFLPATRRGKEVAPMLGVRLHAAVITGAQTAHEEGGKLVFERLFLGGKTMAKEVPTSAVTVVTFPPRSIEPLAADASRSGETKKLTVTVRDPKVKILAKKPKAESGVNLEAAPIVIGAGRGFKNKDDLKLAFDLAATIGGQVGCTRPLATDLGWLTDEYWIGLSGKEVKPKAYFAAGISGQIQHTTGIRSSKIIIAINTNKDAPIFKMADYGIVGDLYKVLPALNAALAKQMGKNPVSGSKVP
ncbi:MAG: electron transfer flavoprotein subunit alpha/FixB family protein [Candidatus Thermoplasmatota archaeon]